MFFHSYREYIKFRVAMQWPPELNSYYKRVMRKVYLAYCKQEKIVPDQSII